MNRQIYASLEFDHERLGRFTGPQSDESPDGLLDFLAGGADACLSAEARELESFLWQRQSHVLGRADR